MIFWRAAFCSMFAIFLVFFHRAPSASARGAVRFEQNVCVLKIGPDLMYFSGYQPPFTKEKFCEDVPAAGETIFVLDYAQPELREMTADFRIVRDVGETEETANVEAVTVAYLPPKVYPTGTLQFEHVFAQAGNYVGIITVDGTHGEHWTSRFPFSVGGGAYSPRTPYYLLAAAVGLALLWLFRRGPAGPPPGPRSLRR